MEASQKAVTLLGGHIDQCLSYTLADTDIERSLVIIEKVKPTKKGLPTKSRVSLQKSLYKLLFSLIMAAFIISTGASNPVQSLKLTAA